MDTNKYITDYHGMELLPVAEPTKRHNENGILHLVKFYVLKKIHGTLTQADMAQFQIIVENITTFDSNGNKIKGLYDRGMGESKSVDKDRIRLISHDNLKAISCFSRLLEPEDMSYHKDIANYGLNNQMRFDNAYPNKPRWIFKKLHDNTYSTSFQWHPRDWFIFLYNGGKLKWWNPLTWLLGLIFVFSSIASSLSPNNETSGKLLLFMVLECAPHNSIFFKSVKKICYVILRKKYGKNWLYEVMKIYHHQDDKHPLLVLSKNLEL